MQFIAPWLTRNATLVKSLDVTLLHHTHSTAAEEESWAPPSPVSSTARAAAAAAANEVTPDEDAYAAIEAAAEEALAAALQEAAAAANSSSSNSSSSGLQLSAFSSCHCYSSMGTVLQQLPVAHLTSLSLQMENDEAADTPAAPAAIAGLTSLRELTISYRGRFGQQEYLLDIPALGQLQQLCFLSFMPGSSSQIQVKGGLLGLVWLVLFKFDVAVFIVGGCSRINAAQGCTHPGRKELMLLAAVMQVSRFCPGQAAAAALDITT
jgi:hypothetical protein